jgi:uncharacterized cupin superfamily protein
VTDEAPPRPGEHGLEPRGGGWYVLNAKDARWVGRDELGRASWLEPEDEPWPALGVNLFVLDPGRPMAKYHAESVQEDFLVVAGECVLLVEGEERQLRAWDFVHCPAWTEHVLIGAGDGPAVVVAVSNREPEEGLRYVASDLARRHGAAAPHDTALPAEAYADVSPYRVRPYRDGDLP